MDSAKVHQVDPKTICRLPQVRTRFGGPKFEEIKASIVRAGILQPVLLRRQGKELVAIDGELRIRAAIELALSIVPALIFESELDAAAIIQRQLIANVMRDDLNPIDQALAIQTLMKEAKCTASEAAGQVGKSAGTVCKLLALLELSAQTQAKIANGEIGLVAAYKLARSDGSVQPDQTPSNAPASHLKRLRYTAVLDAARSITFTGVERSFDAAITAMEHMLTRFKAANKQGIELPTGLAMFKDQAKA